MTADTHPDTSSLGDQALITSLLDGSLTSFTVSTITPSGERATNVEAHLSVFVTEAVEAELARRNFTYDHLVIDGIDVTWTDSDCLGDDAPDPTKPEWYKLHIVAEGSAAATLMRRLGDKITNLYTQCAAGGPAC